MGSAPDDAIDRLYGLALDEFVAARDALAKELRAAGHRDEAAEVKALPKPTVAAWAVNQTVRTQKQAARELWQAGDALAAAQEAILAGKGSGADLRAATERERGAVEPLVDAARGLLTGSGGDLSEATIERVRQTLHAAAIDPDAREEVAAGRAVRERAPQGLFGGGVEAPPSARRGARGGAQAAPTAEPAARKARQAAEPGAKRGRAGTDAATARREREREAAAARRAREEAARERREAAARERARKAAAQRVAKAERTLAAAEGRTAEAAERLESARHDERAATEALAEARAELRALERG